MFDPFIVEYIKEHAQQDLKDQDQKQLDADLALLDAVFQQWKLEHGDRLVKYKDLVGGLMDVRDENKIKSFEDAKPWECAGLRFPSRIGLALKLEAAKYPGYVKLVRKITPKIVYALLIDRQSELCGDRDLFMAHELRASAALLSALIPAVSRTHKRARAGRKQLQNLAKGPAAAAKKKSERSGKYHEEWKKWAYEYWKKAESWRGSEDVLNDVCALAEQHGHKMANGKPYSRKTIQNYIAGVRSTLKVQE